MKIGILSMQEIKNYGSFLQAFALKKTIESLGHQVDFINIIPGKQLATYRQPWYTRYQKLLYRLCGWDFIRRFKIIYLFQHRFSKEFFPYLGVKKSNDNRHHDIIVIGSDEVFNFAQQTWFGFSPQLFGKGLDASKIITYAASFGATDLKTITTLGLKDEVAGYLNQLDCISVRDTNSFHTVKSLTGKAPLLNVDPVLIYDYSPFMPAEQHKPNYIIVYSYPGRIADKKEIAAIRAFAKEKNLKLLSIGHYFPWCDETVVPTPFEVLGYFRDAAYIITDTFHGTIFSIKFNKQFATIVRGMNHNKLSSLLEQFGLESRMVSCPDRLAEIEDIAIDYNIVNETIDYETQKSLNYLKQQLQ